MPGSPRLTVERFESRRLLAAPTIDPIAPVTVPAGRTLQLPVTSVYDGPGVVAYRVEASSGLSASVRPSDNTWVEMKVAGLTGGNLRFQLFDDATPQTVRRVRGLIQSGFYNGLDFHRVVTGQLAQGGDPTGTGTGGAQSRFDDEFDPDLQFTGTGQLAMAGVPPTSSDLPKDQNSSQFFVTAAPQRGLDFNFTLFGQLVRGFKPLKQLTNVPLVSGSDRPESAPTISYARIVENRTDAVIALQANAAPGERQLTVTAIGADGSEQSRTVTVTVAPETVDTPPILTPVADLRAAPGSTVQLKLGAVDLEGDPFDVAGRVLGGGEGIRSASVDQSSKTLTFRLKDDFAGAVQLQVGVRQSGAVARGSLAIDLGGNPARDLWIYDTQLVTLAVGDRPLAASAAAVRLHGVQQLDDRDFVVARFTDEDADADEGDVSAAVDWGDGTVTENAEVEKQSDGTFAVLARHAYPEGTSGQLPVTVYVVSNLGERQTVASSVVLNPTSRLDAESGVLHVFGTDLPDTIGLSVDDGESADGGTLKANVNGEILTYPRAAVARIELDAYDGDDSVSGGAFVPGGRLVAGPGHDTVLGSNERDEIYGGDGDDYLLGADENDDIEGEAGDDTITAGAGKNTVWGGDGDDRLNGSGGRDLIYGGGGDDRIYGGGGSDTLDGQTGRDRLFGNAGDDLLIGGGSIDRIYGHDGADTLYGGTKTEDYLDGGDDLDADGDHDPTDVLSAIEF